MYNEMYITTMKIELKSKYNTVIGLDWVPVKSGFFNIFKPYEHGLKNRFFLLSDILDLFLESS